MIKGYIFDYGGTLDTAGRHWGKVLWQAYRKHAVPVTEDMFREAYVYAERTLGKNPIIQSDYTFYKTLDMKLRIEMEYLAEAGCMDKSGKDYLSLHKSMLEDIYEGVRQETARSREVLEILASKYPLVLVSNFYGNIKVVLKEFHLDHLFRETIESAVVGVRKPDPGIFSLGVTALNMRPEEVAVVGDSFDKDIIPAVKAGCHTIWFEGEGWTEEYFDRTIPDRIITDLKQLLDC